jgi:hypothetical protein
VGASTLRSPQAQRPDRGRQSFPWRDRTPRGGLMAEARATAGTRSGRNPSAHRAPAVGVSAGSWCWRDRWRLRTSTIDRHLHFGPDLVAEERRESSPGEDSEIGDAVRASGIPVEINSAGWRSRGWTAGHSPGPDACLGTPCRTTAGLLVHGLADTEALPKGGGRERDDRMVIGISGEGDSSELEWVNGTEGASPQSGRHGWRFLRNRSPWPARRMAHLVVKRLVRAQPPLAPPPPDQPARRGGRLLHPLPGRG